ncbi:MAG: class I SAM-dependent methyltransferase [Bryobacteraceae bacterium]|jgi:hypothetical protein
MADEGLWVPAGHFYSPIVDPDDAHVRQAMDLEAHPPDSAAALGLDEAEMLRWFALVAQRYDPPSFPESPREGSLYHYANPAFPLADALALLAVMLEKKPKRYVEIGCGFSSCAAIDISERRLGGRVEMAFLDPYPEALLALLPENSLYRDRIRRVKAQDAPLETFTELAAGDILFIDSSHVAKTGSDALDYLFRILPALAPGVLIHVHDIFFPFEYPAAWIVDQNRSWNEAYFLRAFLQANPRYRVIFFSDWIFKCRRDLLAAAMPLCVEHRGGSLWIEKNR